MQGETSSIIVRLSAKNHRQLKAAALNQGLSLNKLCQKLLGEKESFDKRELKEPIEPDLGTTVRLAVRQILDHYKDVVVGIILYGSVARGQQRENSDVDLLVVVDQSRKIDRDIYSLNFRLGSKELSPFFVHLPDAEQDFRGIWLEVAMDGIVLFDRDLSVSKYLSLARYAIASGKVTRKTTYGHSYWVHEKANS